MPLFRGHFPQSFQVRNAPFGRFTLSFQPVAVCNDTSKQLARILLSIVSKANVRSKTAALPQSKEVEP
jgi:hypothetical protein